MAKWGKCDFSQLQKLRDNLAKLEESGMDKFCREMSKELAARLLALVIPRTPVGRYKDPVDFTTKDGKHVHFVPHTGKNGGTLRRGWTIAGKITKTGKDYKDWERLQHRSDQFCGVCQLRGVWALYT